MTEHSFDLAGEFARQNGQPPAVGVETVTGTEVIAPDAEELPRIDPSRGVFITSRGEEIQLSDKPVSSLIIERLAQDGKPKIPMVEVTLMGKHKQLEPHPNHEGYRALLAQWEEESKIRILKYLFIVGVKEQPPQAFIDEHYTFFPGASDLEMKYLYVSSLVPDEDIDAITEAIMGRTMPTTKGVEQVANFTESP